MGTWTIPYDRLDSDQRQMVDSIAESRGNLWIGGFAGSGKSVVLADAAKYLHRKEPGSTIAIVLYTKSLVDMFKTGFSDLDCREITVQTIYSFMKAELDYDYIFCDEVQDFTRSMLDALKNHCRRCVIMAGDKFQSIYREDVRYRQPTVDNQTLVSTMSASTATLNRIYRLTPTIIKAVNAFVPEMGIMTAARPLQKQDALITICEATSRDQESTWTYSKVEREVRNGYRTAILFSKKEYCIEFVNDVLRSKGCHSWAEQENAYRELDFGSLNSTMEKNGLKMMYVGNGYGDLRRAQERGLAILTTYHSAKGLDFDNVYLPFSDPDSIDSISYNAKTVYMVAMTRSGQNLTISYTGTPNPFVSRFDTGGLCNDVSASGPATSAPSTEETDPFDF